MTSTKTRQPLRDGISSVILLGITLYFGLTLSTEVGEYVKDGLELAVGHVIPTAFPFMPWGT